MDIKTITVNGEVYINKNELLPYIRNHGEVVSVGVSASTRDFYLLAYDHVIELIERIGK